MDEALYLVCSALLISIVVWLLNPFDKLHSLLSSFSKRDHGSAEGVHSFKEIPGPKGLPYFGDVFNFARTLEFKDQISALQNAFKKYGPVFKRTIMGKTIFFLKAPLMWKRCSKVMEDTPCDLMNYKSHSENT